MKTKKIISILLVVLMLSAAIPLSTISASAGGPSYYTVTFNSNGGYGEMSSVSAEQGTYYKLPWPEFGAPRGKSFDSWDKGRPGESILVTGDIELVAQWRDCDELEIFVRDTDGTEGVGGTVSLGEDRWDTHLVEKYSQTYYPTVTLSAQADEGYRFVGFQNSTGYLYSSDNPYVFTRPDSPLFRIYAVFEKEAQNVISQVEPTLFLPCVGDTYFPSYGALSYVDPSADYSVKNAFWYDAETGLEPEKFEYGHEYYAEINITCDEGYAFDDESSLLVTVNSYMAASFMVMGNMINIKSKNFKITDYPLILGDADNDGKISILDATTIQKRLANIITDETGRIKLCGDITADVLDITDATQIQKYLAHIPVPYLIGELMGVG